jgi:hypothetical protein
MRASGKGAVLSTTASIASLLAALSCCLPLGTLLFAAGSATASLLSESLRPILIWLSMALIVLAFVQTYFRARCEFRHRRVRTVLLWLSAVVVAGTVFAPRFTSSVLAGRLPGFTTASELRKFAEQDFTAEFNGASAEARLVLLLSPT